MQPVAKEELKAGTQVLVSGSKGADGTIAATQVRMVEGKVVQKIQK
jgi:hypothetical protein